MILAPRDVEIRHAHIFCGLGGGAKGFNRGAARVGHLHARMRCIGGIDRDAAAIRDFERMAHVSGTVMDLFSAEQYRAFHESEPPAEWREATPEDIRRAFGYEHPHLLFLSAPCKGFSGLLSEKSSRGPKYQALNGLTLRGVWLALEAFADDPVELIAFENVPRIQNRGRHLLDQIEALLRAYGYAVAESEHDCGELGGLGQHRRRFLLMARHVEKVPPFLYEPPKRTVRGVGEIIGRLPMPGPETSLPMHRLPMLQWQTWVRLAFVEAGSDWRSLNRLNVADGVLRDFRLQPGAEWNGGVLGVKRWEESSVTVTGRGAPTCGAFSVADPRSGYTGVYGQIGVLPWEGPAGAVTGQSQVGGGSHSVADPRISGAPRFNHVYRIVPWTEPAPAIAGGGGPAGGLSVADPRPGYPDGTHSNVLRMAGFDEAARAVTSAAHPAGGALCVADPRPVFSRGGRDAYVTAGHYGVIPWQAPSGAVTASGQHDSGRWSVADPREQVHPKNDPICQLPAPTERLVAMIRAVDGTYHRPFTTLELAALQSLVDPDEILELDGKSDAAWRERIGNAVPPDAAEAMASVMATTLLLAWTGETFMLSAQAIWVRPMAVALSVKPSDLIDMRSGR